MARKKRKRKKKDVSRPSKKTQVLRISLWLVIFLEFAAIVFLKREQCINQCVGDFTGPYPEIACKYECPHLWEKAVGFFKK